ncbi:MAG: proteasome subunit alpha [Candidatus Verstraetearchaeota archaeon]|nr:proteasome subunit alpha [Candidatus Verstraetearchaeota archaeon]
MMSPSGYDRPFVMYTPDGRLLQVEYAAEAVKYGSPVVAIRGKDFAVTVTRTKDPDPLIDPIEKIHMIDDNVGAAGAGFTGDIHVLIDQARIEAQRHRIVFEDPIDVKSIVDHLGQFMYQFTRYGGVRPLGAALIVVGSDRAGQHLYQLDPRGLMVSGKALAIGKNSEEATDVLRAGYRSDLTIREALDLAMKALSKAEDSDSPVEVGIAAGTTFKKMGLEDALRIYVK